MDVSAALGSRHSVRAFLPREVPKEVLTRIFERAQRASSWCNIQPWRVWVASGAVREQLTRELHAAASARLPDPDHPWPGEYPEPYDEHRRVCGRVLYEAMGIGRQDRDARRDAWMRNYVAFDAPHVAIVGIDRRFGVYAGLDVGCWLEALLLLAHEEGVATCPQASLATYPAVPRALLSIPDTIAITFGIAIGYEDPDAAANRCRTTREPLAANVTFLG